MKNLKNNNRDPEMVFQNEIAECGLACACMFADTQGIDITLEALRARFPLTGAGASLDSLAEIMTHLDVPVLAVRFDLRDIESLPLPAILHFGGNHYVFIQKRRGHYVRMFNPASGDGIFRLDAIADYLTGYALILDHSRSVGNVTERSGVKRQRKARFLSSVPLPLTRRIFASSLIISILAFCLPVIFSSVLDKTSLPVWSGEYGLFGLAILIITLSTVTELTLTRLNIRQRNLLARRYLPGIFGRLISKQMAYFEQRSAADIHQRFASLGRALIQRGGLKNELWMSGLTCLISLLAMFWLHPLLGGLGLLVILLYGVISSLCAPARDALHLAVQHDTTEHHAFSLETFRNAGLVKSAGLFQERCTKFAQKNDQVMASSHQLQWLTAKQDLSYRTLANTENLAMLAVAVHLFSLNLLTMGTLIAFIMVRQMALTSATQFYMTLLEYREHGVIEQRARELLAVPENDRPLPAAVGEFKGLRCDDVIFSYQDGKPVLRIDHLHIRPGEKLAVTGLSGSGKSSLMKMLCGWFTPQQGSLELNGTAAEWSTLELLAFYQRPEETLLHASVMDNITLFRSEKRSRASILIEMLGLKPHIDALPHRENSRISQSNPLLSVGQQQRLMVARAHCSDKPLLLLDEPTANLDHEAAGWVIDTILSSDSTAIVALHDPRLLSRFDRVIHIQNGILSVVEQVRSPEANRSVV
ncbi:ATP-binding cassette domain-containing protein [Enterobacteriaceae bacterium C34A]